MSISTRIGPVIVALLLLALALRTNADDYLWFEGDWVPDVDATIKANPRAQGMSPETRNQFDALFVEARWRIADGFLTSEHRGARTPSVPYSIRPIDAATFEILLDESDEVEIITIHRTESGFCARPNLDRIGSAYETPLVECYVPGGA